MNIEKLIKINIRVFTIFISNSKHMDCNNNCNNSELLNTIK